jgi:hypothetical protein
MNTLRAIALILLSLLAGTCLAQTSPIFLKVRTDVTVVIRKHATGADMVEITMRDANYPVDLLRKQMETFGSLIGTPPRGLFVGDRSIEGGTGKQFSFITANFATDGIILPDGGLRIEPLLKAFAGAPPPFTIEGLTIDFEGITPTKNTVSAYTPKSGLIVGEGRYTNSGVLKGIEYRIALRTQDPKLIVFPDRWEKEKPIAQPTPTTPHDSKLWLILSFIGVGIIGGALVYFALLRTGAKAHS